MLLTVVIPCFNEEDNISDCLVSLLDNSIDFDVVEFLLVDGGSQDATVERALAFQQKGLNIRVIHNEKRIKPVALNLGIDAAAGDYIMRIDAHCTYAPGYIDRIVETLEAGDADNVGGVQLARAARGGSIGESIATVVSHPLGMGDAVHRMAIVSEPRYVDTVFCGCYRRDVFTRIGKFNEQLIRTQDREFNERLIRSGGRILLLPDVHAYYRPRTRLWEHLRWVYVGALWLFLAERYTRIKMYRLRNFIPLAFVVYLGALLLVAFTPLPEFAKGLLLAPLVAYVLITVGEGLRLAASRGHPLQALSFPITVAATHVSYGVGSLVGLVKRLV